MINYRLCVSGPRASTGWLVVPSPLPPKGQARTRGGRGVQPPELAGGEGESRKSQNPGVCSGLLSAGNVGRSRSGRSTQDAKVASVKKSAIKSLPPHGTNFRGRWRPSRLPPAKRSPPRTPRRRRGEKWSALGMRVGAPVSFNGSFVYVLIATGARSAKH